MRRVPRNAVVVLVALCAVALLAPAASARKNTGPRCSAKVCKEAIDACVAAGSKKRPCKKGIVKVCKALGVGLCLPLTTTTTLPPAPTTLDVEGSWALAVSQTANPCGIEIAPSLSADIGITQSGSVLSGQFGENTLAGQFTAADAFVFPLSQFCSAPDCCGGAAISAVGLTGTPGHLSGAGVFEFLARCKGLTCGIRFDGTITQGSTGGGGGGGGGGPKR